MKSDFSQVQKSVRQMSKSINFLFHDRELSNHRCQLSCSFLRWRKYREIDTATGNDLRDRGLDKDRPVRGRRSYSPIPWFAQRRCRATLVALPTVNFLGRWFTRDIAEKNVALTSYELLTTLQRKWRGKFAGQRLHDRCAKREKTTLNGTGRTRDVWNWKYGRRERRQCDDWWRALLRKPRGPESEHKAEARASARLAPGLRRRSAGIVCQPRRSTVNRSPLTRCTVIISR